MVESSVHLTDSLDLRGKRPKSSKVFKPFLYKVPVEKNSELFTFYGPLFDWIWEYDSLEDYNLRVSVANKEMDKFSHKLSSFRFPDGVDMRDVTPYQLRHAAKWTFRHLVCEIFLSFLFFCVRP